MSTCALQVASCFSWLTSAFVGVSSWLEGGPQVHCEGCRSSCCSTDVHYERLNSMISGRTASVYAELARLLKQRKGRFKRSESD